MGRQECIICFDSALKVLAIKVKNNIMDQSWLFSWTHYVEEGQERFRGYPSYFNTQGYCPTCAKQLQTYLLDDPFKIIVKLAKQVHGEHFAEAYD